MKLSPVGNSLLYNCTLSCIVLHLAGRMDTATSVHIGAFFIPRAKVGMDQFTSQH